MTYSYRFTDINENILEESSSEVWFDTDILTINETTHYIWKICGRDVNAEDQEVIKVVVGTRRPNLSEQLRIARMF